jgi:bZIP transcription factor
MQHIKNVTSAENLLQLLRSGRESQDVPSLLDPTACPLEAALTQARELPLTEATLESLNNCHPDMLDAALTMLEQPVSLLMPSIPTLPQSLPLPGELLQSEIPLASLQANKLLGAGFAPVSGWDRGQSSPGDNNSGGVGDQGSEDTQQDTLRGGGASIGNGVAGSCFAPVQATHMVGHKSLLLPQQQQQQQNSGRPQRQTAKRALELIGGSTHQSVADEEEEHDDEDELSDTEDASDAGAMSYGKRMHLSSSGAQSFQRTTSYASDSLGVGGGGGSRQGNKKQSGRPLQRKSYDALVDPTLPPEEVRRIRRILSNRESARRSRKRKATQISALEDELMEVRMAATQLENELIEALTAARGLEMDRSQLVAEVDLLRKKVKALERSSSSPVGAAAPPAAKIISSSPLPSKLPSVGPAKTAVAPTHVARVPSPKKAPFQMAHRQLSLPLPAPIKVSAPTAATAPPVLSLPCATPIAATTKDASPEPPSAGKAPGVINNNTTRRGSPSNITRSPHFQSPLRQGGSHVSHRVRFRPIVPPTIFPNVPRGDMHHEEIDHGLLL